MTRYDIITEAGKALAKVDKKKLESLREKAVKFQEDVPSDLSQSTVNLLDNMIETAAFL